jgi:hypothetical protein
MSKADRRGTRRVEKATPAAMQGRKATGLEAAEIKTAGLPASESWSIDIGKVDEMNRTIAPGLS